ncbi:DUF3086 domain-containing protein [Vulcanococcus limneticus Candia 3F8]|uniref:DUF3086 domain-containing protein n=1 Tax=Vulcanococcus limneticus TaxID=2170428 RepID=UPI000B9886EA|nr:DUF3086 domain-containing protein [Vulcanococcus limneticus]MCP9792135.1 DUF3086 domain-containing protein [Vulcanococcus limneticus MW73D5]MCP9893971.1 DUF3086 domain-containing protein [Vulcanococcus limneticus Candia 3F8]MCP9897563.1 DUF3086 domain-containing protein [Vulcanococcus limneticus Candia 3B3]
MSDDAIATPPDATPALEPVTEPTPERDTDRATAPAPAPQPGVEQPPAGATAGGPQEQLLELALGELQTRRGALLREISELEGRREQLQRELGSSFFGQSDAIARRLKGFQDYLVGALQDLASAAEQMELVVQPLVVQPSPLDQAAAAPDPNQAAPAAAGLFSQDEALIQDRLAAFQGPPDFYADPWKLRRSLEPSAAALLDGWFLAQGGRGAQPSTGSRNRNALVAAAAIAILGELYGKRFQTLVLAGRPERLGEWRRGLQDCLGLSREDFGPNSGIVLFERADALIERADRLEERGELPFIVVDAAEQVVDVAVLQFPVWLAFAPGPDDFALEDDLL